MPQGSSAVRPTSGLYLYLYIQAILCPKTYDMSVWEHSPFSALITCLPIYQRLLVFIIRYLFLPLLMC